MTRKSKHANGHSAFTKHEFGLLDYGTATTRVGSDSQIKFGVCPLSLQPIKVAVCTPSGSVYEKESILSYLATKGGELKEWRSAFEAQNAAKLQKLREGDATRAAEDVASFEQTTSGVSTLSSLSHGKGRKASNKRKGFDVETREEKVAKLRETSYWLASYVPEHEGEVQEPPERPASPNSGNPLRLKDLVSIDIQRDQGGEPICAVSKDALKITEVVALKKTGVVMSKGSWEQFGKKDMICPITSKKIKEGGVIELKRGTTGFAASGNVEAKKYKVTMT
ncbi:hypothetical protein ScalyP_jg8523 [Parmales sp. scaly parma]|nr:hypothetical protein ScalyP_jg8523 [Parmales sp. scaly parma]